MISFKGPSGPSPYLVQFVRFRRGAREITRTLSLPAGDAAAALGRAKTLLARGNWPARTDALRVLDDGGRTLIDWEVPGLTASGVPTGQLAPPPA